MARHLAERIVAESVALDEKADAAASLVCRFLITCDMYNVHRDELLLRRHKDGLMTVRYKTLRWPRLSSERAEHAFKMVFINVFGFAWNRYGTVDQVVMQLDHDGLTLLEIPWAANTGIDTVDLVVGELSADKMFMYLWGCAKMAAEGLLASG